MNIARNASACLVLTAVAVGLARADSAPLWGPHIDIEAKPGSKRTLGEVDLFLPLSQDSRTLVFGNLRARLDNQSSYEGNFGAGVRRMVDGGWNLGAYGYWDHRRSANHNFFDQATLGAEALGRDWDFRANGYLPFGTRAYALAPTSTAALSGASVSVTTAFNEERALKGFDFEAGWRAPIFDSEAARQLRLYAGGYRFSHAGTIVDGPRLRAELTLDELPWFGKGTRLFLGAEMQDDNARGGQSFLSVRLRIPLGQEVAHARPLSAQERRMTAPVMRDVDIVTQNRVASTLIETASTTAGGQALTVLSSDTTTGAALPGAVAAAPAANAIILSGTFNTTAVTRIFSGQSLMAGAVTVRTASGRSATVVTSATIAGTNVGSYVVRMSGNNTLSGLTITGTQNNGTSLVAVHLDDTASNITFSNNTISGTQTGNNFAFGVRGGTITNLLLSGNTITLTGTGLAAQDVRALVFSTATVATVTGNTLSASGGNVNRAVWLADTTINAGSTGNTISAGVCTNAGGNTGSIVFTNSTTCP